MKDNWHTIVKNVYCIGEIRLDKNLVGREYN